MIIDFSSLPVEIKDKLPLSLQLETGFKELTDLPPYIQKLIIDNSITKSNNTNIIKNLIDVSYESSVYDDIKVLKTKRESLIDYIRNYLLTSKGTYPFDPSFGNLLKTHLQTRDTSLRETLIDSELKSIITIINESFNTGVEVIGSRLSPSYLPDHTEFTLDIQIKIYDDIVVFTVA